MTTETQPRTKRPAGIWIVSVLYLLSAGWTFLSFVLIFGGVVDLNEAQRVYFASLGTLDWLLTLLIGAVGIVAAIALFLLRRIAVPLFATTLALNVQHRNVRPDEALEQTGGGA